MLGIGGEDDAVARDRSRLPMSYAPPFRLSHAMLRQAADIAELVGAWNAAHPAALVPQLRRGNRIRSIQASLAIEQNTLSVAQVTAVLAGKSSSTPSAMATAASAGSARR